MHRIYLAFSLFTLSLAIGLTGCGGQSKEEAVALTAQPVVPGESKPIPPGESKPIPSNPDTPTDPNDQTLTDPQTLPVLPVAPTAGNYEEALSQAFMLVAEQKDTEALQAMKKAQSFSDTDFIKSEIARLEAKIAKQTAAQDAVDDIKEILSAGDSGQASKLATEALAQYGDTEAGETLSNLKRQADALIAVEKGEKNQNQKLLADAEAARQANNYRAALLSYDQAASVATPEQKTTYDTLRTRIAKYDQSRAEAADLSRDPYRLEEAIAVYKVAQQQWDTPSIQQDIATAQFALANRKDRVAVADFEVVSEIGVTQAGRSIAEELVGHFRPKYEVVERSQSNALLQEMKLDANSLAIDDENRVEFGRLAKAQHVVLGSVQRISGIHVNARLVNTQTGLVEQTAKIVAASPEEMVQRLPLLARMLQMSDEQKRDYEQKLAQAAKPIQVATPPAQYAPAPQVPSAQLAPPAPIVIYSPRPPEYGTIVVNDFNSFQTVAVGTGTPVVVMDAPLTFRDRALFVAIEVGDNCFRRGDFHTAMRHYEFALSLNPGFADLRLRIDRCRPFCVRPMPPVLRPRLVVLPFVEFRSIPSTIPPGLGLWTADAIAPYFLSRYDIVDKGELFWWMGRLGITMRDVLANPQARLMLGRVLGARYFLMGTLRDVASFDATTHLIDAEWNAQVNGAVIRVNHAAEFGYRLGELANLTLMPRAQQVVVVQQQQVVQQNIRTAHLEFGKGNFRVSISLFKQVLTTQPTNIEARQMLIQVENRQRQSDLEAARLASWQQQQVVVQRQRDQQIALAAAAEAARRQAQRDAVANRQVIQQQQLLAQQNLIAQANLAQRQNNLEQRIALLESANSLRRDEALVTQLAQAKAQLAVEQQKRRAAEESVRVSEAKRRRDQELAKVQAQLALEKERRQKEEEARLAAAKAATQKDYDRFIDIGQKAMTDKRYPAAVGAFQNARRLKPSPEIEALVSSALVEQARADAEKKGAEEKKKLDAQLALEEQKRKQLEAENAQLREKYQAALVRGQRAMEGKNYGEAVQAFQLASQTMKTDEALTGLKLAQTEMTRSKEASEVDAKQKAQAIKLQGQLLEGRKALAAKQFDKSIASFKAATAIAPDNVDVQKELAAAIQARDDFRLANRPKEKETAKVDPKPKMPIEPKKTSKGDELLAKARQAIQARDLDTASKFLAEAAVEDPRNIDIRKVQAEYEVVRKSMLADTEAKKKQEIYQKAMSTASQAIAAKKFDEAIQAAKEALTAKPNDPAATRLLASAQKMDQAADTAAMEAQKKKEAFDAAIKATQAALAAKNFEAAVKSAGDALKIIPNDATALALQKQARDAQTEMMASNQKKQQYEAWMKRGNQALIAKDYETASESFSNALKLVPADPDAVKGLTTARTAMAQPKTNPKVDPKPKMDPQPKVDPKTKVDPKPKTKEPTPATKVTALLEDADEAEDKGKYSEALQLYQEVLKLAPANPKARNRVPFTRLLSQAQDDIADAKWAEANQKVTQALKLIPNDQGAKKVQKQIQAKKK
jgi:tetratricopeptide (TPR) repeat protein